MHNPTRQMEKQPNQLLWHGIFLLIVLAAIFGIYKAVQSVDYTWRWERIPSTSPIRQNRKITPNLTVPWSPAPPRPTRANCFAKRSRSQPAPSHRHQRRPGSGRGHRLSRRHPRHPAELDCRPHRLGRLGHGQTLAGGGHLRHPARHPGRSGQTLPNPALRNLAVTYVELIRGTPLLVQIFIVYFFIGTVLNLDRFTAGVAALAVFTGAYVAEIVRAGISSIHKGQMEAGRSLGMTSAQTMRYVILPQAFKRVLPPLAGQFINLIKDSSLVSVISITDLTKAGREVVSSTFSPFEVWFTVALLYLVLTGTLSFLVRRLEVKYARSN